MLGKKMSVTIKDIAVETGYSVNTISRALRDKDDIAAETRIRIKEIAGKMGYVNNTLAASLRLGYTSTLAVILGDIANPHFAIMMKEIEACARKLGYTSIFLSTNEDEILEMKAIEAALNKNVDGIIICPAQRNTDNLDFMKRLGVPFVLIGRCDPKYSYVVCNDVMGGYQATKTLLDAGHREILLLHGAMYISSARDRLKGYRRAYEEAGVLVNESLIREVSVTADGCEEVLKELDREGMNYTAIFAFSDMLAWEAWCCLLDRGLDVPKDCSIVGFDHIQSRMRIPFNLTSISTYKGRMSTAATQMLVRQIKEKTDMEQLVIDTTLTEGCTVAENVANS